MTVSDSVILVPAAMIDTSTPCLFWPEEPGESLAFSLARLGQMEPVLVARKGEGFALVAGRKRVEVLAGLGRDVLAREVEASDLEQGLLSLATNSGRALTGGMRFAAMRYFKMLMTDAELISFIAPLLGLSPKSRDTRLLIAWFDLPDALDPALVEGRLALKACEPLSRMTREEQMAVVPFFEGLAWPGESAAEFLSGALEAARAREEGLDALLAQGGFYPLLGEEGLAPGERVGALLALAQAARDPELARRKAESARLAAGIAEGTAWRLARPDGLETPAIEISARVAGPGPLSRAVADLSRLAASPLWEQLFGLTAPEA